MTSTAESNRTSRSAKTRRPNAKLAMKSVEVATVATTISEDRRAREEMTETDRAGSQILGLAVTTREACLLELRTTVAEPDDSNSIH